MPAVPVNVPFYARTTRGERNAIDAVLAKKTERMRAVEPLASSLDYVGWFRALVRREAEAEGVAIVEPSDPKPPRATARKPARSRK